MGPEGVIKALTARSGWKRDEAAAAGSDIHGMAERIANGEPLPEVSPVIRSRVEAYATWWASSGWQARLTEAFVVDPVLGYGGTLDLLAYDETGRTVLADVKSGANVYPEVVLQLLAYAEAALIAPQGSPIAYPMPPIDRYAVLHLTDGGCPRHRRRGRRRRPGRPAGLPATVALAYGAEGADTTSCS